MHTIFSSEIFFYLKIETRKNLIEKVTVLFLYHTITFKKIFTFKINLVVCSDWPYIFLLLFISYSISLDKFIGHGYVIKTNKTFKYYLKY